MKHDFIQQVRADPRKTLCVITGMANLRDDGSVNLNGKVSEVGGAAWRNVGRRGFHIRIRRVYGQYDQTMQGLVCNVYGDLAAMYADY